MGEDYVEKRCRKCGAKSSEWLPQVDKKVLYLDQFAVSEIFKVKKGKRAAGAANAAFWAEAEKSLARAILRQQVICPASDIHHHESIVFSDGKELELAHEMMGGDTSFEDVTTIQRSQVWSFLEAFSAGKPAPVIDAIVDGILIGNRNRWLPDLHITVNSDWSSFVDGTRQAREQSAANMLPLYERWKVEKPGFEVVLKEELAALGPGTLAAYWQVFATADKALAAGNHEKYFNAIMSPVVRLVTSIVKYFERVGFSQEEATLEMARFLSWEELRNVPYHWNSAHLFAAVAQKLSSGQKKLPSRGMMNDVSAIATYGPYVDAMFLDKECAALLREGPLRTALNLKARIFSLNTSEEFLAYLSGLSDGADSEVVRLARELYGAGA